MSGNTFGTLFKVTTFGESHGIALGAIVDVQKIMATSRTLFAQLMLITLTIKNMASAIIVVAVVHLLVKPQCELPQAPLLKNT